MRTRDENKKAAIREKAIEMIVKEGLDGFGVNKLARAAGVSPATIYIYYKDKEDLISRLGKEAASELLQASLQGFDPEAPFSEGLRIQWQNRADYFLKHPLKVQFVEQIRYSPSYESVTEELTAEFGKVMGKFVTTAIARRELLPLPVEVYWAVAFAPLYQLIRFHVQGRNQAGAPFRMTGDVMMKSLELVLKALKP